MGRPRKFDHDEARALYATGEWTQQQLADKYDVSDTRINQIMDPERNARVSRASALWTQEHYHQPCSECGARIWKRGNAPTTGLCMKCLGLTRRTAVHGTESRYRAGCRCDDCRRAQNTERARRRRTPNVKTHGTHSGYSNGCRCDECRNAHRIFCADRRANKRAAA